MMLTLRAELRVAAITCERLRLSVRIFGFGLEHYGPIAAEADRLGFDGLFVPDHLVAPLEFDASYPYRESGRPSFVPETPFADPFVMLGHLAAATQRIRLGVGVFVLPLRNVFAVAKAAATVQRLSGGRLLLGVGAGWCREEFDAVGARFDLRGARGEEMLEVMAKLWSGEPAEHAGRWYTFPPLQMSPAAPPPPVLFGGTTQPALTRAARLGDGWYCPPASLEQALAYRGAIDRLRIELGTEHRPFRFIARVPAPASRGSLLTYAEAGLDDLLVEIPRDIEELDARLEWLRRLAEELPDGFLLAAA